MFDSDDEFNGTDVATKAAVPVLATPAITVAARGKQKEKDGSGTENEVMYPSASTALEATAVAPTCKPEHAKTDSLAQKRPQPALVATSVPHAVEADEGPLMSEASPGKPDLKGFSDDDDFLGSGYKPGFISRHVQSAGTGRRAVPRHATSAVSPHQVCPPACL
jgi:hypothetical protein